MSETLLEIKNLAVEYVTDEGVARAVNGVNLTVGKGETVGLVGESGAGKTTTAMSIMGLLPEKIGFVRSGEILLSGRNLLAIPKEELRLLRGSQISMIFQDPMSSLNPVMTVGDQILEAVRYHFQESRREMDARVDRILDMVGIHPSRKIEYPQQFSGGMRQRIVIAIALVCNPEFIIADEPTTALDVTIQAQVLEIMEELKKQMDTSMILITHDLGVVSETCDRVAIMYTGEIIESGTVEDIFDHTVGHHPYTEGLFGSIPNLKVASARLSPIDGLMPDPQEHIPGCKFHPRCPKCQDVCREKAPEAVYNREHMTKCHFVR